MIYKKFDEKINYYEGEFSIDGLEGYLNIYLYPIVIPFDESTIPLIFIRKNPAVILFASDDNKN